MAVRSGKAQTPRSEVRVSLRGLTSGSTVLPWTTVILSGTSTSDQRAVGRGRGVVCSRAASGGSGRDVPKRGIAVPPVGKRLGAGGDGKPVSAIGPLPRGASGGRNSTGGIGSGGVNDRQRQLTRTRRARASAQRTSRQIFRRGRASGRVATNFSPSSMNIRVRVFAAWRAAWRCVACWIAKRGIGRGGAAGVGSA
jgi:hypothetical protein